MVGYIILAYGVLMLAYGLYAVYSRVFLINKFIDQSILLLILYINIYLRYVKGKGTEHNLIAIIILVLLLVLNYLITYGKYMIYNTTSEDTMKALQEILNNENIKYAILENNQIKITELDKSVEVSSSFGVTTLNIRSLRKTEISNRIIKGLKCSVKKLNRNRFSIIGLMYLGLGVLVLLTLFIIFVNK